MRIALTLALLVFSYLLLWPVEIRPQAWTPPPAPSLHVGPYAENEGLRTVQRLLDGSVSGPEAVDLGADGRLYSGLADGRVIAAAADGSGCRVLANTGGRPLGLAVQADGRVLVADALKGLIEIAPGGEVKVLATQAETIPFGFPDDLDVDSQGRVYFSDASWKSGYGHHLEDVLEHRPRGRLLRYDPAVGEAYTLLTSLYFANGVALGPDESYVLVNESTEYRITRFWLKGERAGQSEPFAENLPGIPDNLSFNGTDRFWVALYAPRNALLDWLLPRPFLRKVVARLPQALQDVAAHHSFVIGLDLNGKLVEQYQFADRSAYAPITHVQESGGYLYLGSLSETAIGRVRLDVLRGTASAEPAPPLRGECVPRA